MLILNQIEVLGQNEVVEEIGEIKDASQDVENNKVVVEINDENTS